MRWALRLSFWRTSCRPTSCRPEQRRADCSAGAGASRSVRITASCSPTSSSSPSVLRRSRRATGRPVGERRVRGACLSHLPAPLARAQTSSTRRDGSASSRRASVRWTRAAAPLRCWAGTGMRTLVTTARWRRASARRPRRPGSTDDTVCPSGLRSSPRWCEAAAHGWRALKRAHAAERWRRERGAHAALPCRRQQAAVRAAGVCLRRRQAAQPRGLTLSRASCRSGPIRSAKSGAPRWKARAWRCLLRSERACV
jgi:hypothetical protein